MGLGCNAGRGEIGAEQRRRNTRGTKETKMILYEALMKQLVYSKRKTVLDGGELKQNRVFVSILWPRSDDDAPAPHRLGIDERPLVRDSDSLQGLMSKAEERRRDHNTNSYITTTESTTTLRLR